MSAANTNRLKEIAQASRQTVRALDEIVWAVNPRKDSLIHLLEYISQYANSFFAGTEVRCRQDLPATVPDWVLPAEFRHHLFLAAKEALNNIQKHAQATEVWIRVAFATAPRLELSIEDNGTGFSPRGRQREPRRFAKYAESIGRAGGNLPDLLANWQRHAVGDDRHAPQD
jgi:signal transduction histidine kinase